MTAQIVSFAIRFFVVAVLSIFFLQVELISRVSNAGWSNLAGESLRYCSKYLIKLLQISEWIAPILHYLLLTFYRILYQRKCHLSKLNICFVVNLNYMTIFWFKSISGTYPCKLGCLMLRNWSSLTKLWLAKACCMHVTSIWVIWIFQSLNFLSRSHWNSKDKESWRWTPLYFELISKVSNCS